MEEVDLPMKSIIALIIACCIIFTLSITKEFSMLSIPWSVVTGASKSQIFYQTEIHLISSHYHKMKLGLERCQSKMKRE